MNTITRINFIHILMFVIFFEYRRCLTFIDKRKYDESLQVKTENGIVQGFKNQMENGNSAFIYRGIPFAKPPIYDLRFRSPQYHPPWSGVLDATLVPPSCVEIKMRLSGITINGTEDCLYLNVHSPVEPRSNKLVSVIFWIYGGSFVEGNTEFYDPEYFLKENVLVVTANYRMSMFGFLSTEDEASPGNYGLKDQNAVLRWIQRNIRNFGGDPDNVTIIGESAGGCAIMYHMVSPKSRGLFHKAIAMSGTSLSPWCHQRHPLKIAKDIGLYMGLSVRNTTAFVESLRKLNTKNLIHGQFLPMLINSAQIHVNGLVFTPVVEGDHKDAFVTKSSYELLEKGDFARVPLMIGGTSMEFNLFFSRLSRLRPLLLIFALSPSMFPTGLSIDSFTKRRLAGSKVINSKYFKSKSLLSATDEELINYFSDIFYNKSKWKSSQLITKYVPVFSYIFDYQGEGAVQGLNYLNYQIDRKLKGTGHAEDLLYLWKSRFLDENDKRVSKKFVRMLSNFAKYGNPTPEADDVLENVIWPPTTLDSESYLHIGENLTVLQNYKGDFMQFWEDLCNKYCEEPLDFY